MSKRSWLLAAVYFLLVTGIIVMQSPWGRAILWPAYAPPVVIPFVLPPPQSPDYSGEEIVYDVKMGALKIGTSTFHHQKAMPYNGIDAQLVTFVTNAVQIHDTETIWADTKDFLPLRIERDVKMWPKYERIIEQYDQKLRTLDITKTAGGKESKVSIAKKGPIQNAILLPYQVRRIEKLAPGWSMAVTLPTQEFRITLKSVEKIHVPAGDFEAFYFESDPKRFEIWISSDDRRIPVKIKGSSGLNYMMLMRSYSK
jgi:hypothetical protein